MSFEAVSKQAYYTGRQRDRVVKRYWEYFGGAERVLDLGCGIGEFGRHSPGSVEVHGLDIDPGALEIASRWEAVRQSDLEGGALPYADGFFDGVLAKDVLEHLVRPEQMVPEIRRVLKPGGVVLGSVVMAVPRRVWADYTHIRGFTERTTRMLFEDAGFEVQRTWPMGGMPLSGRLGFVSHVPLLLRAPLLGRLWGSSWEILATNPPAR